MNNVVAQNFRCGVQSLLQLSGIGQIRPNTGVCGCVCVCLCLGV